VITAKSFTGLTGNRFLKLSKLEATHLHSGKRIAKNTLINLGGQVLPLIVGIVTIPLLIKGLGIDRFGILTMAWMVIGYFSLFDLGLGRALTQIIAKRLGVEEEVNILPGLVWTALAIMTVMGVIGTAIAGLLSPLLIEKVFKMSAELRVETLQSFFILSASIPVIILSSGFVGILTAYQRFDLINAVRLPLGISNFIVPLLVLKFSFSIVPITLFLAGSRLISCVAQYCLCLRVMPSLRNKKRFMPEMIKPLFNIGGWMTVSNIVSPLMVYLDRFLIGAAISVTAVAYYATPYEVVTKLWIASGSLITTLFPAFAASGNHDARNTIHLLSKCLAITFIFIFPIALNIVAFSHEGLFLWLGKDFAQNSTLVMQWLAAGVFINCLASVVFVLIQGLGRPDLTAKFHLLEVIFYWPILWWALKQYSIVGAAVVWTLRIVVDGLLLLWATQRLIPLARKLIFRWLMFVLVALIALLLSGFPYSLKVRVFIFGVIFLISIVSSLFYLRRNRIRGKLPFKGDM
jgi:O-antigen/teichoic acid export membrane protein